MEGKHISKRWFGYYLLYFIIAYSGLTLIITGYQLTGAAVFYILINVYHPIVALAVAYLYFRKARNDWQARFVTAIGWTTIFYLCALILLQPVHGIPWTEGLTFDMIRPHWMNVVGIIVAGMAVHRSGAVIVKDKNEESALKQELNKK